MKNIFESVYGEIPYDYLDHGSEKTLLLLHGFMEDHSIWKGIQEKLEANIILVDLLGFGKSKPKPSFQFTMHQHADSLEGLIDMIFPSNLYILGHSMGGYIALELLTKYPELSVCLLHSTCVADNEERIGNRNKTIEVLQKDPNLFIREFYWNLFAEKRKHEFRNEVTILKEKAYKIPVNSIIATVKGLRDRKDHSQTLRLGKGDNLIIGGTYDKLIPVDELKVIAEKSNCSWMNLDNSGHMGFYEEPKRLVMGINRWLEDY